MNIDFAELMGSPIEEYTPDGFSVRRIFLVRTWKDRDEFAIQVLGVKTAPKTPWRYPGNPTLIAVKVRSEPFEGVPTGPESARLRETLVTYGPETRVKITVWYEEEQKQPPVKWGPCGPCESPHPQLCVAHGGSAKCEQYNEAHGFTCRPCKVMADAIETIQRLDKRRGAKPCGYEEEKNSADVGPQEEE